MSKKLYVGNLSYETSEATLAGLFGAVGQTVSVDVVMDRMSGRSRGFAFVEMAEDGAAAKAIQQLNGHEVDGRSIKVNEAAPRKAQSERDGWRGGGRSRY